MPISSLIVRTKADQANAVCRALKTNEYVSSTEVHGDNIVLVTQTENRIEDKYLWDTIENVPGVLQCDLIYHNFEDVEDADNE